ncbi:MAG: hypothetical protein LAN71_14095 [Acidobacteriia bacterium]|nr:hypothetical protein [Terriglobia bacterium]
MSGMIKSMAAVALALVFAGATVADTLELKDGRVLQGRFAGGTQAMVRFEVNGQVETYSRTQIIALTFTNEYAGSTGQGPGSKGGLTPTVEPTGQSGYGTQPAYGTQPGYGAPPVYNTPPGTYLVPAGTPVLVRMIDTVDSNRNHVGDIFHASLETDLIVNDVAVARKGTDVYGRLAEAKSAGHYAGSSELQLELTRMVVENRDYMIMSSDYEVKGKGRGSDTAKKVGVGAVGGAIIGAIAGGGEGAAIGAAAGTAAGAGVQVFTKGQQVRVPSETVLEFRLEQPVYLQLGGGQKPRR